MTPDELDVGYRLVRLKRPWVPEWLWRVLARWNLPTYEPLRTLLTCELDEFTDRRLNGK